MKQAEPLGGVPFWDGTLSFLFAEGGAADDALERVVIERGGWVWRRADSPAVTAAFRRVASAMHAAVELQRLSQTRPATRCRCAVVAGDVDRTDDGRWEGPVLRRGERLLTATHPGQVLSAAATWALVADELDGIVAATDVGVLQLGGSGRPTPVVQIYAHGPPPSFPSLRGLSGLEVAPPRAVTALLGRADAVAAVHEHLTESRITTVVGPGGVGKTRVAMEVASTAAEAFERVCWVDLAATQSIEHVIDAIASATGLVGAGAVTTSGLVAWFADRADLVVLDNCEQILGPLRDLVPQLVAETPVTLLATSREPLGAYGETVQQVQSLAVPGEVVADPLTALEAYDSARLFVARARQARPDLTIDREGANTILEICRRLDGLPLALELAAAHLATSTLGEVAAGLEQRLLVAGGASGHRTRHRTLDASIGWSYALLSDAEQRALYCLSVFSGPFNLPAAAGVLGDGHDRASCRRLLDRLVRASMLVAESGRDGATDYRFLEMIRAYALERLIDSGQGPAVRARHVAWVTSLCRAAGVGFESADPIPWVERCRRSLPDIREAIAEAVALDDPASAVAIVGHLAWFWVWRGLGAEARTILAGLADHVEQATPSDRLAFRFADVWTTVHTTSLHRSIDDACARWARDAELLDDPRHAALASVVLGSHTCFLAPATGRDLIGVGLEACREVGDDFWATYAVGALALSWLMVERFDEAAPILDAMADQARSLGNPQLVADLLSRRVLIDQAHGRYDRLDAARRELDRSFAPLSGINVTALPVATLMCVEATRGRADIHLPAAEELLTTYLLHGELQHVPVILGAQAELHIALGQADRVEPLLAPLADHPDAIDQFPYFRIRIRFRRALAALALDDSGTARRLLEDGLGDADATGNLTAAAESHLHLAILDRRDDEHRRAFRHMADAAAIASRLELPQLHASAVEVAAALVADTGQHQLAARLVGAALPIRREGRVTTRLGWQHDHDLVLARLREHLGGRLDDEIARGGTLSLDEAIAAADRRRGPRSRPVTGWDSLTPTEHAVADLAASGRTNPQIAEELLMGRETVKSHLSSIYRKLNVPNRSSLAAAVARHEVHRGPR